MFKNFSIDTIFQEAEKIVYIVTGLMLFITAGSIIASTVNTMFHYFLEGDIIKGALHAIDKMLLTIMVVEILYTVKISIKSHVLTPEPFLIVGLIASIRRILVISVEGAYALEKFKYHMTEISILGVLILVFMFSMLLLKRCSTMK